MSENNQKFISLKEAGKISGYSPDYVGQLIRQGKLEGKQVFKNVAWVTTEEALRAYLEEKNNPTSKKIKHSFSPDAITFLYRTFSVGVIAFGTIFLFALIYIFSVSIDQYLQQKTLETKIYVE